MHLGLLNHMHFLTTPFEIAFHSIVVYITVYNRLHYNKFIYRYRYINRDI